MQGHRLVPIQAILESKDIECYALKAVLCSIFTKPSAINSFIKGIQDLKAEEFDGDGCGANLRGSTRLTAAATAIKKEFVDRVIALSRIAPPPPRPAAPLPHNRGADGGASTPGRGGGGVPLGGGRGGTRTGRGGAGGGHGRGRGGGDGGTGGGPYSDAVKSRTAMFLSEQYTNPEVLAYHFNSDHTEVALDHEKLTAEFPPADATGWPEVSARICTVQDALFYLGLTYPGLAAQKVRDSVAGMMQARDKTDFAIALGQYALPALLPQEQWEDFVAFTVEYASGEEAEMGAGIPAEVHENIKIILHQQSITVKAVIDLLSSFPVVARENLWSYFYETLKGVRIFFFGSTTFAEETEKNDNSQIGGRRKTMLDLLTWHLENFIGGPHTGIHIFENSVTDKIRLALCGVIDLEVNRRTAVRAAVNAVTGWPSALNETLSEILNSYLFCFELGQLLVGDSSVASGDIKRVFLEKFSTTNLKTKDGLASVTSDLLLREILYILLCAPRLGKVYTSVPGYTNLSDVGRVGTSMAKHLCEFATTVEAIFRQDSPEGRANESAALRLMGFTETKLDPLAYHEEMCWLVSLVSLGNLHP